MDKKGIGEVKIASDVVAIIAGLAATEVEGAKTMSAGSKGKSNGKNLSKGVQVMMEQGVVRVDIMINVLYGYSIKKTSEQVQSKISQQIETMTGLCVSEVNVRIAGVSL